MALQLDNLRDSMAIDTENVIPPGQHPNDPANREIDPIAYALKKLQTYMFWLGEHASSYEKYHSVDSSKAENELNCLKDAYEQAILYLQRLTELLIGGYQIDPQKVLPRDICSVVWNNLVQSIKDRPSREGKADL